MGAFTQDLRLARLVGPLGPDELLLVRFSGEEALSQLFHFHLELQSETRNVDPASVLRKPGTLQVTLEDGSERHINGLFSRFSLGTSDVKLTTYWAELVPWTYFLSLRRDCRIFQEKSAIDIVSEVFDKAGFTDFKFQCGDRPPRQYCVQYRESDLNFVQRLLEEEGIFYFFEHAADKHTLVMADKNTHIPDCPPPTSVPMLADADAQEDVVTEFALERSVRIGAVAYRDYDHLQPSFTLDGEAPGQDGEEVYEYWPGRYTTREEGERLAKYKLEAEEARREQARGRSTCRNLIAGHKFTLVEHINQRANDEYVLTSVQHDCSAGDYRSTDSASFDYSNKFTCIPMSIPFRPRQMTAKPVIVGSQTALVVGPAGEEIYTDEHGRVKLHFHWDRLGNRDENSSCWIRVSHPWAGQGWGAVSIPRIGQEVIVDFLEGDPDQPIVTGRVYNAQNAPPFGMPDGGMISGIKSNSTPGGGGYNGIEMNDTKGKEGFSVHAQYNMDTVVENDQSVTVNSGNRTMTIKAGTLTDTVKGDAALTIQAGSRTVSVTGGDYSATASAAVVLHGKGQGVSITGDAKGVGITGNGEGVAIIGNGKGVGIEGNSEGVAIIGNGKGVGIEGNGEGVGIVGNGKGVGIKGDPDFFAEGTATAGIKAPIVDIGDKEINIVGTKITIAAGASTIVLDAGGISIQGPLVKIN
jgi:type VI secretion system secreted protein VgrG